MALAIDGIYLPLEIPRIEMNPDVDLFTEYINKIRGNSNVRSLVISNPYKQRAFKVCDELDERATICGAVNLIVHRDNSLIGSNIDGEAFLMGARAALPAFKPQHAVIFGCGGVSTVVGEEKNRLSGPQHPLIHRTRTRIHEKSIPIF